MANPMVRIKSSPESGMSTLILLVALAIGIIVFTAIQSLTLALSTQSNADSLRANFEVVRRNIITTISDYPSWQRTIQVGAIYYPASNMSCLVNYLTAQCSDGANPYSNMPFVLYESTPTASVPIADSVNPNAGFNDRGEFCWGFDVNNATNGCYYRYDLRWRAVCVVPNCMNPYVEVTGQFQVARNVPHKLNLGNLSLPSLYLKGFY